MLWVGLVAVTVYAGRRLVEVSGRSWLSRYIPILGGLTETLALFLVWVTVLQAWRTGRPPAATQRDIHCYARHSR